MPTIMAPNSAKRLRAITWHAARNLERWELAGSAAHAGLGRASCFIQCSLFQLDPGVQPLVDDVNEEVDKDIGDRDEQNRSLNDRVIARVNAFDQQPADARPGKHGFDDGRAAQKTGRL